MLLNEDCFFCSTFELLLKGDALLLWIIEEPPATLFGLAAVSLVVRFNCS